MESIRTYLQRLREGTKGVSVGTGCSRKANEELTINCSLLGCSTCVRHRIQPVTHQESVDVEELVGWGRLHMQRMVPLGKLYYSYLVHLF